MIEDPTTTASALLDNFLTSFLFFIPKPTAIGNFVNFFKFFISVSSFVFDL